MWLQLILLKASALNPQQLLRIKAMKTWMCNICGWIYEEEKGCPEDNIAPGTKWEDVPVNWTCPECGARKEDFEMIEI
jgi:rubredoxin